MADIRIMARSRVKRAIKDGVLKRPARCSWCGRRNCRIVAHHEQYERPLEVEWICDTCHNRLHTAQRREYAEWCA